MLINNDNLTAAQIGFRTMFNMAFELARPQHELIAMEVPSTRAKEQYKWVGTLPKMREWLSEATFERLEAFGFEIVNKDWQTGLEVDRNDLEDDALGLLPQTIQMMGTEARRHPGELVFQLVNNGFTGTAYDGQTFFSATHKDGDGPTQSNRASGGGSALSQTSFRSARTAMRRFVDQKNRPLSIEPTHLLIPPELEGAAKDILQAERLASGASNTEYKAVEMVVSPYFTSATAWFLFDLSKPIKPFVYQTRRAPVWAAQDNPTDERAISQKIYRYSVDARYNVGYGLWQLAYGSVGA